MQREREGRNDIFGMGGSDPFGNFRGFGMMPSLFGGRDPFDDPFFTRPFGSWFESGGFEPPSSAFGDASRTSNPGVVIQEVTSEDEEEMEKDVHIDSSKEPSVEHPDDHVDEEKCKNVNHRDDYNKIEGTEPQVHNFSFQTSKVTYGGVDGAYYTSTRSRRAGSDGVIIEESKEADKTTGQASHRISRGIHDKGHSVTRKLNSEGKVDTVQTLHNLNEDELSGFEAKWNGNVKRQLPGWSGQFDMHGTTGSSKSEWKGMTTLGGWALPSAEQPRDSGATSSQKTKNVVRINIE
ncbi:hypothetical protein JCGZ_14529 [Jatropha curcas]|uniref:Myeloid leukemia factor n=1 Tax=Jatropha curcas TaxID=180498 RepID=A0A067K167_JATCU|nr:uncharacterized protein LOC105643124 isoform X2 [Jatropha curcas]KDP28758.1 hypothetical protein JCGZ_14529 [Jatropha curcas]